VRGGQLDVERGPTAVDALVAGLGFMLICRQRIFGSLPFEPKKRTARDPPTATTTHDPIGRRGAA
jgi:hypothetical protein